MRETIMESISDLAVVLGVSTISHLPACWEYQVNKTWWFAFNGHGDPRPTASAPSKRSTMVPAFSIFVEYNGWPAGFIHINAEGETGEFAAHPDDNGANDEHFRRSLQEETDRVRVVG